MSQERLARQVVLVTPTENGEKVIQAAGAVTTSRNLLVPILV